MAQPAVIRRWSETSLFLLEQGRPTEAFLLAWVSWEAYLERVILLGLTRQGLSVRGAQEALGLWRGGSRSRSQEDALTVLFGVNP